MSKYYLDNEKQLVDLAHDIQNSKSLVNTRALCISQTKMLDKLIDIYHHKLYCQKSKEFKGVNLPKINNKQRKFRTEKDFLLATRKNNEEKKRIQAKNLKDKMNILRENFGIYKGSMAYENLNKRRFVERTNEIVKNAINKYKNLKKEKLQKSQVHEIQRINMINKNKFLQYNFLKSVFEKKEKIMQNSSEVVGSTTNTFYKSGSMPNLSSKGKFSGELEEKEFNFEDKERAEISMDSNDSNRKKENNMN
ncbi:MAG: hypothetical protein MJ252_02935, partial [archaeon]|nr:hypothetical protein [archaeon]